MSVSDSLEHYARQLGNDVYLGMLGRLPSNEELSIFVAEVVAAGNAQNALSRLVSANSIHSEDDVESLSQELHWKKSFHLFSEYVMRSCYLALLGREPESKVLASSTTRLQERDLTSFIRGIATSAESSKIWSKKLSEEFQSGDETTYRKNNEGIDFKSVDFPRLNGFRELALVHVPFEGWLYYALAVAKRINEKYGYQTVLVYQDWSPAIAQATMLDPVIFDVIHMGELKKIQPFSTFSPKIISTHSFGWPADTKYLLSRFPKAKLLVYADGLKNAVSPMFEADRKIEGAVFFGYANPHTTIPHETTVPVSEVFEYVDKISDIYDINPNPIELAKEKGGYAVVYLRYWGKGIYAISLDEIVKSMVDTICQCVSNTTPIVIKDDPRALPTLYSLISGALIKRGYEVSSFKVYLEKFGINPEFHKFPAEYFFSRGLLCCAKAHVVFDSSLGYIVATNKRIERPAEVIVGADVSLFAKKLADETIKYDSPQGKEALFKTIHTIRVYSGQYSKAILSSTEVGENELLDGHQDCVFHIRLN